ncbi:MBL fold metallo-hydrolase RNA specificity domain-containing protein [Alteromonas lipolytica]|uniref:MBL fold metallo-hydrolase n=1 Tax=Alteromonas lipolytica TaxID=1856405 RepID=A0A1E8FCL7_9ALTE|nr:MBL fold metallo-hydrolase [Alteromonas lipolytica]OFI33649.1 MBL fold metallo-hydrolase [Alteromonas lipolytica]GGF69661.1 MBL fold metallo-hydrolase [Alteromonas lipolytica]
MATVTFYGAVDGVTGSMHLVESGSCRILLDCGLYQGGRDEEAHNDDPFPFSISEIDAVVLSHAHLDHSGRLPLLVKDGYQGPIYMTSATQDLIDVLLKDAASLQMRDVEWENKRRRRAGKAELTPLYNLDDVEETLKLCHGLDYNTTMEIAPDISITLREAGHILGSSVVQLTAMEAGRPHKLVFSGDLGNSQAALLRDPAAVADADVVLMESTYGDREHRSMEETLDEFEDVITRASQNGGNILIPSFAVGRTQEIIFRLGELYQQGKLPQQLVCLDSPMAIAVTEIYHRYQNVYNQQDKQAIEQHSHTRDPNQKSLHSFLPTLRYAVTTEESIAVNRIASGAIIIAGSGMCNGGRIRHHLKHNLWRSQSHVIFVGYQAVGTPGRILVDGATHIRMAGEDIAVKAQIHTLGGFSAHASQSQLIDWFSHFENPKPRLYLVHGEDTAKQALKSALAAKGWRAEIATHAKTITF